MNNGLTNEHQPISERKRNGHLMDNECTKGRSTEEGTEKKPERVLTKYKVWAFRDEKSESF